VANLYESYASLHTGASNVEATRLAFRRDVQPYLPNYEAAQIVDLGCGQGLLVKELTQAGYGAAWGVDISPEQVALAHGGGITAVQLGDFHDALEPGASDVIIAFDFLEHLPRQTVPDSLRMIRESLAPGGMLIARVPNATSPFAGAIRHGDFTHESWFTAGSVRQLCAYAGFESVDIRPCEPPIHGAPSAIRFVVWKVVQALLKLAFAAETGQRRGVVVTQNLVFIARVSEPALP
jgi:SAM-dependent methyltransferase